LFDVGNQSAPEIQICSPANDDEGRESEQPGQDLGIKECGQIACWGLQAERTGGLVLPQWFGGA